MGNIYLRPNAAHVEPPASLATPSWSSSEFQRIAGDLLSAVTRTTVALAHVTPGDADAARRRGFFTLSLFETPSTLVVTTGANCLEGIYDVMEVLSPEGMADGYEIYVVEPTPLLAYGVKTTIEALMYALVRLHDEGLPENM